MVGTIRTSDRTVLRGSSAYDRERRSRRCAAFARSSEDSGYAGPAWWLTQTKPYASDVLVDRGIAGVYDGKTWSYAGGSPVQFAQERAIFGPERVLFTADRAAGLRALPDVTLHGSPYHVVAFTVDGAPCKLTVNARTQPAVVDRVDARLSLLHLLQRVGRRHDDADVQRVVARTERRSLSARVDVRANRPARPAAQHNCLGLQRRCRSRPDVAGRILSPPTPVRFSRSTLERFHRRNSRSWRPA